MTTNAEEIHAMSTAEQLPEIMTRADVAAVFAVDPKTVTRWAKQGRLASFRTPGGHRRFRGADVAALLRPAARS